MKYLKLQDVSIFRFNITLRFIHSLWQWPATFCKLISPDPCPLFIENLIQARFGYHAEIILWNQLNIYKLYFMFCNVSNVVQSKGFFFFKENTWFYAKKFEHISKEKVILFSYKPSNYACIKIELFIRHSSSNINIYTIGRFPLLFSRLNKRINQSSKVGFAVYLFLHK